MTETNITLQGINYFTLHEGPDIPNPSAPTILLCHALMSNMNMWDHTVPALHAAGYATLRFDHVGHHNTPRAHDPDRAYHMDDIARHMHQLVKEVTGKTEVDAVVGCSIGGILALRYAMLFPDDVRAVVSIAAPGMSVPEKARHLWAERIDQFEKDVKSGKDELCFQTVERWFPGQKAEDEGVREEALRHVRTCSIHGYRVLADTIRSYEYKDEVGKIRGVRCLVIAGSEDAAADPAHLREVAGQIEGGEYMLMEGAGHLPPMHQPEKFNTLLVRFLGQK